MRFQVVRNLVVAATMIACLAVPATAAERPLALEEAVEFALKKNEGIFISRESAAAAEATASGARGVYNPLFDLDGYWRQTQQPVNSAFSGAPPGEGAPTTESVEGSAVLSQYIPTGARLSARAITGRFETNGTFDLLSPAYQTRVGVELRQPLLRGFSADAERTSIRVADADRKRSSAELRQEISDTVAEVERAYWDLAAARAEVRVREESVQLAEAQLAETEARVQTGAAPETEISQPRAELERRRGELFAAREAASRADTALKVLMLADDDAELWEESFVPEFERNIEIETVDRGDAMERALTSRPELEVMSAIVERRAAERSFSHSGTRPALDAVVSYDRFGIAGSGNPAATDAQGNPVVVPEDYQGEWGDSWSMLGDGDFDDVRAGLVFSYPIGNDAAQAADANAKHAQRQAEAEMARTRKFVRAEVLDAIAALETAGQRIEATRAGREAAEIQLSAEKDRYDAGLSTNFLVLTRQNDLSSARLDEISAHADYRIARTGVARATGALLDQRGITVEDTARGESP
ncbi:MAG: TolC family protein [Candidatus Latescibacteria bacterium]|nr:TolC family protein [Candidatus Latescibacterota bacterium]